MPSVHFLRAACLCTLSAGPWPVRGGGGFTSGWAKACDAKAEAQNPMVRATTSLFAVNMAVSLIRLPEKAKCERPSKVPVARRSMSKILVDEASAGL